MSLYEFAWAHNSWMSPLSASLNFFARALVTGPIGTWTRSFEAVPWSPSMAFFHHCWRVVERDVLIFFEEFYQYGKFDKFFNDSLIALIPKKNNASHIRYFRPISSKWLSQFCKRTPTIRRIQWSLYWWGRLRASGGVWMLCFIEILMIGSWICWLPFFIF